MSETDKFKGVFCAVVTPVKQVDGEQTVDETGLRKLIRHVIQGGVHGLVVLGTSGEFASIPDAEKLKIMKIAADEVKGRIPVLAGTGSPTLSETVELTTAAEDLGLDGVLVVPPYYYLMSQNGIVQYFRELSRQVSTNIFLYNIPSYTKNAFELETVKVLSEEKNIAGIKDTSMNFQFLQKLVFYAKKDDFNIFSGTDGMLAAGLSVGMDGVISISCNFDPIPDVDCYNSFREGRMEDALTAQKKIDHLLGVVRTGVFPAGLKAATSMLGFMEPDVWFPGTSLGEEEFERLRAKVKKLGYSV